MAFGVMPLPLLTFGLFSIFSGYFLALRDFGLDAAAFAVMLGAVVDFSVNEGEELGEVGGGPALDAAKERINSRHFCSKFTSCSRRSAFRC
jgi:hypothetical protein